MLRSICKNRANSRECRNNRLALALCLIIYSVNRTYDTDRIHSFPSQTKTYTNTKTIWYNARCCCDRTTIWTIFLASWTAFIYYYLYLCVSWFFFLSILVCESGEIVNVGIRTCFFIAWNFTVVCCFASLLIVLCSKYVHSHFCVDDWFCRRSLRVLFQFIWRAAIHQWFYRRMNDSEEWIFTKEACVDNNMK